MKLRRAFAGYDSMVADAEAVALVVMVLTLPFIVLAAAALTAYVVPPHSHEWAWLFLVVFASFTVLLSCLLSLVVEHAVDGRAAFSAS